MKKAGIALHIISWVLILACAGSMYFIYTNLLGCESIISDFTGTALKEVPGLIQEVMDFQTLWANKPAAFCVIGGMGVITVIYFLVEFITIIATKRGGALIHLIFFLAFGAAAAVMGYFVTKPGFILTFEAFKLDETYDGYGLVKAIIDAYKGETITITGLILMLVPMACLAVGIVLFVIGEILFVSGLTKKPAKTVAEEVVEEAAPEEFVETEPVEEIAEEPVVEETPVVEEPVAEEPVAEEPVAEEAPVAPTEKQVVIQYFNNFNSNEISIEKIREIIREELAKMEPKQVVVEKVIEKVVQPEPQPVVVAPVVAPAPVEVKPAPVAPAPVKKVAPVAPAVKVAEKAERIPFDKRILTAEKIIKSHYNELKSYALAYGVNSRVSNTGDSFRLHTKTYLKITVAGKSLKLYYALNPKKYANSTIPVGDASKKSLYTEIPLVFKVRSDLSLKRAKQLIDDAMAADGLEMGEIVNHNHVNDLK